MSKKRIAIVGGGITGLTAAYDIQIEMERLKVPYEVKLIEASDRLGGKINTVHKHDFILERGPDSFLERKKSAVNLVKQLGLTDELVRNNTGQARVLVDNTLHNIPAGSYMGIPVTENALTGSDLISEKSKQRVKEESMLPKGDAQTDQSLGQFLRRRFGDALIENLVEPLLSGIYSSDIDEMSLMASFPTFYELEQTYGSVIQGLKETLPTGQASTGKRKGQFLTLRNGLETLVDKLYEALREDTVMLQTPVEKVTKQADTYHLQLNDGQKYEADAVIMAIPHSFLPDIFEDYSLFSSFKQMPMSSVANVVLAFNQTAIREQLDGTGFVVSRNSDFRMTACTWTHRKWPTTAPEGKALLRVYVGKPSDQEIIHLPDEAIISIVRSELESIMGIQDAPEFTMVTRWENVMPQYTIGHVERVEQVRRSLSQTLPGVYLAGSSFEGVGIPDCIKQGKEAAAQALKYLQR